ncbi:MAG: hypothetical protein IJ424_00965 [Oscillospiraceae bacterium]|nr:hypothetical protein [Oscillospiraceae bacterium]
MMDGSVIVLYVFIAVFILYFVWILILEKKGKEEKRRLLEELETPFEPAPAKAIGAKVVLKTERIEKRGSSRSSSHRIVYEMTFDTDEREVLTLEVPAEIYYRYNELDTSTLVTVDGKFFYFGEGEEIEQGETI